ncbi:MAG TPA: GNAT family N-acetyltransferase [Alphaproteobacteria bacterium]|nr:GNAT family N-acetyltransferase [Alphaproteobacteria bacterium]
MRVNLTTDPRSIEAEWWRLWRADPHATPFQSPAWLIPWAEAFVTRSAGILTLELDGALAALLPVFRHKGRWLPWGAGTSDWLDGVYAPGFDAALLAVLVAGLDAPLDLFQLPPDSPWLRLPGSEVRAADPCLAVSLPAAVPRQMAHNLAYYRRRAARAGIGAPVCCGPEAFGDLVALHTRRWRQQGEQGVLTDPRVLAWHREALPRLAAAHLLRLYAVRQEHRTVGVLYVLAGRSAHYDYIGGFDPDLASCGLGTILVGHALTVAERDGARTFDFLRGSEAYKYHWGATERASYARLVVPAGFSRAA